jgi:hypothetical protein
MRRRIRAEKRKDFGWKSARIKVEKIDNRVEERED